MGKGEILIINNLIMDILKKIDKFLLDHELGSDPKFIEKEIAVKIINLIIENVEEDKILLETINSCIKSDWRLNNKILIEKFYKILSYYGIIDTETESFRKTVLENKGKTLIRKFIAIKNKKQIKKLLKKYGG